MSTHDLFIKLIIIGNTNVGKTKIIERYIKNIFNPDSTSTSTSTVGIDFFHKQLIIRDSNVKLQVWDTAGQEQFMAITSSYIRNSNGIILVYDITNPDSYNNLKKWLKVIKDNSTNSDYEILLLGNKSDIICKRKVGYLDGIDYAISNDILIFEEVSALENSDKLNKKINEFLDIIVEKMIKDYPKESLNTKNQVLTLSTSSEKKSNCC